MVGDIYGTTAWERGMLTISVRTPMSSWPQTLGITTESYSDGLLYEPAELGDRMRSRNQYSKR